ncbi:MAG: hypothetical protein AB4290_25900 [Spirulina sp.]
MVFLSSERSIPLILYGDRVSLVILSKKARSLLFLLLLKKGDRMTWKNTRKAIAVRIFARKEFEQ